MKKITLLILPLIMLTSCNNATNESLKGATGLIDCYSVRVYHEASTGYSNTYSIGALEVHEFKNDEGNQLYFATSFSGYNYQIQEGQDHIKIAFYGNKEDHSEYSIYSYVGMAGYVFRERNLLLDLSTRTLTEQQKFSECKYKTEPYNEYDNKKAYNVLKNGFYTDTGLYDVRQMEGFSCGIYKGYNLDNRLERNKYYSFGEAAIIEYVEKWF